MNTPKDTAGSTPPSTPGTPEHGPACAPPEKLREPSIWEIYFPFYRIKKRDVAYLASFPMIVYLWPAMLILFMCAGWQYLLAEPSGVIGWIAVIALVFNLVVLVQDFDQKQFIILLLVVIALGLIGWILRLYGFTFIRSAIGWFFSFQPLLNPAALFMLGLGLLVLFVWGMITPLFSYWRFEPNEFVHYVRPMGRHTSIARTGCTVNREIPDVLEYLLGGGGGTLLVRRENQALAVIPHVPFLGLRMRILEDLLSETRVVVSKESEVH